MRLYQPQSYNVSFKVSHPRCVGEHNISKTAVEIVFNTTVLLELKYLTYYKVRHVEIS